MLYIILTPYQRKLCNSVGATSHQMRMRKARFLCSSNFIGPSRITCILSTRLFHSTRKCPPWSPHFRRPFCNDHRLYKWPCRTKPLKSQPVAHSPYNILYVAWQVGPQPLFIYDLSTHIYLGASRLGKYGSSVVCNGYGPPYRTIYILHMYCNLYCIQCKLQFTPLI